MGYTIGRFFYVQFYMQTNEPLMTFNFRWETNSTESNQTFHQVFVSNLIGAANECYDAAFHVNPVQSSIRDVYAIAGETVTFTPEV
jgi:hypothetical protein